MTCTYNVHVHALLAPTLKFHVHVCISSCIYTAVGEFLMSALTYPVAGDDLKAVCFEVLCSMLLRRLVEFDAVTDGDTRYEGLLTSEGLGEKGVRKDE